jgi:DNA-binding CsgD family transcriptional regulator
MPTPYPSSSVLVRPLDDEHRMLLIVHQHAGTPQWLGSSPKVMELIADKLCQLLGSLWVWRKRPGLLGVPFGSLTTREWEVLQVLDSETGEKQLANDLSMSAHTLHSHIKSIYRKMGVQGRLPLLKKFQDSVRNFRLSAICEPPRTDQADESIRKGIPST